MQVFKYYSYASNIEKGEVRSAFKSFWREPEISNRKFWWNRKFRSNRKFWFLPEFPVRSTLVKTAKDQSVFGTGGYRKFPTGNSGGTGNSGLNRKFGSCRNFRSDPRLVKT